MLCNCLNLQRNAALHAEVTYSNMITTETSGHTSRHRITFSLAPEEAEGFHDLEANIRVLCIWISNPSLALIICTHTKTSYGQRSLYLLIPAKIQLCLVAIFRTQINKTSLVLLNHVIRSSVYIAK